MEEIRKTFRAWDAAANATQTFSPASELPEDDLVFFLLETIPQLDLEVFYNQYTETRGAPPFDVDMMCTLLAYSYCVGVFSSRKIAAACERNLAFKAIVGSDPPDFRTISEAIGRLKEEARRKADALRQRREADDAQREAEGQKRRGRTPAPVSETPEDKAQTNFTDPDAHIMKRSNKGFDDCDNAQAVVDEANQIIVGAEATVEANDKKQAVPMVEATLETIEQAGIDWPTEDDAPDAAPKSVPISMDSGYFSEQAVGELRALPVDPHIATGRQKHNTPPSDDGSDEPPADASVKQRMAHKLRTPEGRACYAKRKHIVEPVFGQMKHVRGFRQFLLRGLNNVRAEWKLICLTHNLLKIWRHQCALT